MPLFLGGGGLSDASAFYFRIVRGPHQRRPRRNTVVWHDRACVGVRADRLGSSRTNAGEAENSTPYTYVRVERAHVFICGVGVYYVHSYTFRPYEWSRREQFLQLALGRGTIIVVHGVGSYNITLLHVITGWLFLTGKLDRRWTNALHNRRTLCAIIN